MTDIVRRQSFEFACIAVFAVLCVSLCWLTVYTARLLSGRKRGIVRQVVQAVWVAGCFVIGMVIANNGAVRFYHLCIYLGVLCILFAVIKFVKKMIKKGG